MLEAATINITGRVLSEVDRADEVVTWSLENKESLEGYLVEYDLLINEFNKISVDDPILGKMPKAAALKESLDGHPLPNLGKMAEGTVFVRALLRSKDLILKGQQINKGEITATPEEKNLAIGTPSYKTSLEALAVGTAAHLAERTFFEWAKRNPNITHENWKKDDWLHGLKDILLLLEAKSVSGTPMKLTQIFLKLSNEDGLGWLTQQMIDDAKLKFKTDFFDI